MTPLDAINSFAWIGANVLVAYITLILMVFVAGYYFLFDPKATTAGRYVFRFMVSLMGIAILIFIGQFIDSPKGREWYHYPMDDTLVWRPIVRFVVYAYVSYTITALAILLGIRKWKPEWVTTAQDRDSVKVRSEK